jgi:hypothetical protein
MNHHRISEFIEPSSAVHTTRFFLFDTDHSPHINEPGVMPGSYPFPGSDNSSHRSRRLSLRVGHSAIELTSDIDQTTIVCSDSSLARLRRRYERAIVYSLG